MKIKMNVRLITTAAIIAAMYTALTLAFLPLSFREIQFRFSEALTILPFFTPAAIWGLFVGCLISNIFGGNGPMDIIFGSLATLLAAYLTHKMPRKFLAPVPPILVNAVIIGGMLSYLYKLPLMLTMFQVGFGELVVCYALGYPLMMALDKVKGKLFK